MFNIKKYRILSLILIFIFSIAVLAGCTRSEVSGPDNGGQTYGHATLTIEGYNGMAELPATEVPVTEGMTCMDILDASGLTIIKSNGMITSIDGLADGIDGYPESGWVFTQNGESPLNGADECVVKDKDSIVWLYALTFDFSIQD